MKHIGGSGKPDCIDENDNKAIADIKDYKRNFNSYDLRKIINRPWAQDKKIKIGVIHGCSVNVIKMAKGLSNVELDCNLGEKLDCKLKSE